jgi:hypothetical protein
MEVCVYLYQGIKDFLDGQWSFDLHFSLNWYFPEDFIFFQSQQAITLMKIMTF